MKNTFVFEDRYRKYTFLMMGVGLLGLIIGVLLYAGEPTRIWANLLLNSYYFMGISLIGVFFVAANTIGYGGWYLVVKRVFESMGAFLPVAAVLMLIIVLGAFLHIHDLYHWAHEGAADNDRILAGKMPFFNPVFYIGRTIAYFAIWIGLAYLLRQASLKEGLLGEGLKYHHRSRVYAALFLVSFAVFSSSASWDYIMSIDTHWYSTLFGWYNFASYFVAGFAMVILLTIFLKSQGYLALVTIDHLHDLGKYMFAFSVFWTYLWFSQFMLIWYANIPEETIYFKQRFANFEFLFYLNLVINFIVPFFALMKRGSKRTISTLVTISIILLIGHWLDFYIMIMPGSVGASAGIGLLEILLPFMFLGGFLFMVFSAMAKAPLLAENNPFYEESLHHHT